MWNNGLHKVKNVTFAAAGLLNILSGAGNFGKIDQHAGNMEFNIQMTYAYTYMDNFTVYSAVNCVQ
jgi:hypothetical protein